MRQWYEAAIDLRTNTGMTNFGVHCVRKVDGRCTDRQRDHLALGREHENLVLLQVGFQVLHEGGGVADLGLPVDDAVQPIDIAGSTLVLVRPVRRNAPLGPLVHLASSNLHLDGFAARPDHRGVQALVEVELRHCDVVLEATHHWLVPTVDAAQCGIAILHRIDDHAHRDEVEDVVELATLLHHLFVDAPQVLAAAGHLCRNAKFQQTTLHFGDCLREIRLTLGRASGHQMVEFGEALRVQRGERQIFQLLLQLLHAQPMGQRCIDLERFVCDALLLFAGHRGDGAHVVQPVGQLDDEHTQVASHRHQHLAHRGCLLRLLRVELQALELGDTVDDLGDLRAETLLDVGEGDLGIFDCVVQQRCSQRDLVET